MANERITEDLVDEKLRNLGYYEDAEKIIVEKQQSAIELVRKSLSKASKTGGGGGGFPEFIITAPDTPRHDRGYRVQGRDTLARVGKS